jgi:hypothetical protein
MKLAEKKVDSRMLASGGTEAAAELINGHAEWLMKQGEVMEVQVLFRARVCSFPFIYRSFPACQKTKGISFQVFAL